MPDLAASQTPGPGAPTIAAPAAQITPYTGATAIGIPSVNWLDTFTGEACHDDKIYYRIPLTSGETDAVQIIRILNKLQADYAVNTCVIGFARCLVQNVTGQNDKAGQLSKVVDFVRQYLIYQADPGGIEYVRSPVQMMRDYETFGYTKGDCDDQVLFVNSILGALGIQTRAIGLMLNGSSTFNHVISQINTGGGTWTDYDPCNPSAPFTVYPVARLIPVPS